METYSEILSRGYSSNHQAHPTKSSLASAGLFVANGLVNVVEI